MAGVQFNLAHAGELMLVAVAGDRPVGVDLEPVRPMDPSVAALFAPAERAALLAAPTPEAFCRCWVRKEAFLKAVGSGLQLPLDGFAVTVNGPAAITHTGWDPAEARRWRMAGLEPAPGYVGAVVARGSGWALIPMGPLPIHGTADGAAASVGRLSASPKTPTGIYIGDDHEEEGRVSPPKKANRELLPTGRGT